MINPDEVVFFSGNSWGVSVADFVEGLNKDDSWNINEYFTLVSDGDLVQALVIGTIFRS